MASGGHKNILIGCSGSVATVKLNLLLANIKKELGDVRIKVILTESAKHFTTVPGDVESVQYCTDMDEWGVSKPRNIL